MGVIGIDHVQLAMPAEEEVAARAFYSGLLGLLEIEKPEVLARRGGAWFQGGEAVIHLGVEAEFRPARKAHPALLVTELGAMVDRLEAAGVVVRQDAELPGYQRAFVKDPFGNRIELMERTDGSGGR
jgi:catechol 2,3-dioxygenase-like lactoylglutathione lyase family enzyme